MHFACARSKVCLDGLAISVGDDKACLDGLSVLVMTLL